MTNPNEIQLSSPVLLDKAIQPIQLALISGLSWLTKAFGNAQKHKQINGGKTIVFPSLRVGGLEHFSLLPDQHIGNYSFFYVEDGQGIDTDTVHSEFMSKINLIFFFDIREVYPNDWETKNIENVKYDILQVLKGVNSPVSQFRVNRIFQDAENVFNIFFKRGNVGFSNKEIDNQFTMMPYGALRFTGNIKYHELNNC